MKVTEASAPMSKARLPLVEPGRSREEKPTGRENQQTLHFGQFSFDGVRKALAKHGLTWEFSCPSYAV